MSKQLPPKIKRIEEKEKKGARGKWRRGFCDNYLKILRRIQGNTQKRVTETAAEKGEQILAAMAQDIIKFVESFAKVK